MSLPTSRAAFKTWCLRKLGSDVIEINVSDDQVDDRVDEALQMYWDYHFDGSTEVYYKYQVQPADIVSRSITLPENLIGVTSIMSPLNSPFGQGDMFNIRYQIALNDMYNLTSISMIPYFMMRTELSLIEQLLVGLQPIRFNRHTNICHLDADWTQIPAGSWLIVVGYQSIDPTIYTAVWSDRWLLKYATQLIKKQWASNMSKFKNMQLPGGVTFNADDIYNQAEGELEALEKSLVNDYSLPNTMMMN